MKICCKCGEQRDNSAFKPSQRTKDKLSYACDFCKQNRRDKQVSDYRSTKRGHIANILAQRKFAAKKQNMPFDIDLNYLESILTDRCPVLGIPLSWGEQKGKPSGNSPSVDKIIPELGYVEGNVMWMSHKANTMKNNATPEELKTFANWILTNA